MPVSSAVENSTGMPGMPIYPYFFTWNRTRHAFSGFPKSWRALALPIATGMDTMLSTSSLESVSRIVLTPAGASSLSSPSMLTLFPSRGLMTGIQTAVCSGIPVCSLNALDGRYSSVR